MRNFLLATAFVMASGAAVAQSADPIIAYKLNGVGYVVGVRASGILTAATNPPPALSFETPLAGAGSPGGSNGQVQYNNGGVFGAYTNAQLTALMQAATASLSGAIPAGGSTGKAWNPTDGWFTPAGGGGGSGTVTSVNISTPSGMQATGGPITVSGTIALAFTTQAASFALIAPVGGGLPVFRQITNADVLGSAPTASPTFTGTPLVPTAAPGTNTTQAASTAFVAANQVAGLPSATTTQLYGGTGGAGVAQPISLGTGLSISGTTLNASGGGGGSTAIAPVTYTAAGAISASDAYSLINSSAALAVTLASGTNGIPHAITNYGSGQATLTLSLYGTTQAVTLNQGSILSVFYDTALSTYLYAN